MSSHPLPSLGEPITPRERVVIAGAARGNSNTQMSQQLALSRMTIKSHMQRAGRKLGAHGRAAIVGAAYRRGILASLKPEPHERVELKVREHQVLHGMARGLDNLAIGQELGIAEDTVKTHAKRLYRKLVAADRAHAVALAYQHGYLPLPTPAERAA